MNRYDLVPELREWDAHNGGEESLEGWASCIGSFSLAAAYASLFWPAFVVVRGRVFRQGVTEQVVDSWLGGISGNLQATQATINHLHLLDVQHPGVWGDATDEQMRYLGNMLRTTWSAKLAMDFPERKFVVEFIEGSPNDLREYQVLFYEPAEG